MNKVYQLDLTNKMQFGPIKKQILYERFTDGRISGLLAEDLAKSLYNNISKAPNARSSYDFVDDDGKKYECRTITARGASLLPSNQLGKGRTKDIGKFYEKLDMLYAFVFLDVRDSPIFRIVAVPVDDVVEKMGGGGDKVTPQLFKDLIANMSVIYL